MTTKQENERLRKEIKISEQEKHALLIEVLMLRGIICNYEHGIGRMNGISRTTGETLNQFDEITLIRHDLPLDKFFAPEADGLERALNGLRRAKITTLRQLVKMTQSEFQRIPGLGRKTMMTVRVKLSKYGLDLGMDEIIPS